MPFIIYLIAVCIIYIYCIENNIHVFGFIVGWTTALHISSENGHTDTMVALLEGGADINARDKVRS